MAQEVGYGGRGGIRESLGMGIVGLLGVEHGGGVGHGEGLGMGRGWGEMERPS